MIKINHIKKNNNNNKTILYNWHLGVVSNW